MPGNVDARTRRIIDWKETWEDDEWVIVPENPAAEKGYWRFVDATRTTLDEIAQATLLWDFGRIKYEDWNPEDPPAFKTVAALDYLGYFVRIRLLYDPAVNAIEDAETIFIGQAVDTEIQPTNNATAAGTQVMRCLGLEHLLRVAIRKGRALETTGAEPVASNLGWAPTHNRREQTGGSILGNRSENPVEGIDVHYFSSDREVWNAEQAIKYWLEIIKDDLPEGIEFDLTGQVAPLQDLEDVWNPEGKETLTMINEVIDRRVGLYAFVDLEALEDPEAESTKIPLRVRTTTDVAIEFGAATLPANEAPTTLTIPSEFPFNHVIQHPALRFSNLNRVDRIVVQGQRAVCVCSFNKQANETLEGKWSTTLETAYKAGTGAASTGKEHDEARTLDKYEGVYTTFGPPRDWDFKVGGGETATAEDKFSIDWVPQDDGIWIQDTVAEPPALPGIWRGGKRFERWIPLEKGLDYSTSPPTEHRDEKAATEFLPMRLWVYDDGYNHSMYTATEKWWPGELLGDINEALHNISVRPADNDLAVEIQISPRHQLAAVEWDDGDPADTMTPPQLSWQRMVLTAAIRVDQRQRVVVEGLYDGGVEKVIDVPDAEFWYAGHQCVVGITPAGDLAHIHASERILRDDKAKLETHMAFAQSWYGVERQPVTIPLQRLTKWVDVGQLLIAIEGVYSESSIRTVINKIHYDGRGDMVTISTGWGNRDLRPAPIL
jgi:hypothetical protein